MAPLWSILVCKIPQFWAKATDSDITHHTFLESRHPEITKNPYHVLSPEWSQKKASPHELCIDIPFSFTLKLITTLLQKLATFYIWNYKQKDLIKTQSTVVMVTIWLLCYGKHSGVILRTYHITLFSKTCPNLLFVIGFS